MPHPIIARGIPVKVLLDPIEALVAQLPTVETSKQAHKILRAIRQQTLSIEELLEDEDEAPAPAPRIQDFSAGSLDPAITFIPSTDYMPKP